MDGLVVPIAENLLIACCDAMEPWLLAWLKDLGFEIIDVKFSEARNLGVNLMCLGDDRILAMTGSVDACKQLRAHGFTVEELELSMFTLGGGGIHCLSQALRRTRLT